MKKLILLSVLFLSVKGFTQQEILDKAKMCQELTALQTADQLYRGGPILGSSFGSEPTASQVKIDSVWALQIAIDNRNTERLIALTEKYGWLSDERVECPDLNIWIIFRHAQQNYFDEISVLIEKELKAGRISKWHHQLIQHHLNGRPR